MEIQEIIKPISEKPHSIGKGIHKIYRFENGYGASVVRFWNPIGPLVYSSYTDNDTEWELAVIKFKGDDYSLCYDTKITDDVIGHLSDNDVQEILKKIKEL